MFWRQCLQTVAAVLRGAASALDSAFEFKASETATPAPAPSLRPSQIGRAPLVLEELDWWRGQPLAFIPDGRLGAMLGRSRDQVIYARRLLGVAAGPHQRTGRRQWPQGPEAWDAWVSSWGHAPVRAWLEVHAPELLETFDRHREPPAPTETAGPRAEPAPVAADRAPRPPAAETAPRSGPRPATVPEVRRQPNALAAEDARRKALEDEIARHRASGGRYTRVAARIPDDNVGTPATPRNTLF